MCPAPVRGNDEFPKPTAQDAVDVALATFEAGQRVDMAQIAARLGVGRSTLYRWVGDRDELMDQVIDLTTTKISRTSRRRVRGKGLDRVASAVRVFLDETSRYEPLRSLAEREPQVALHLVMDPDGVFAAHSRQTLHGQIEEHLPGVEVPEDAIEVLNVTNQALVWAAVAGGNTATTDRVVSVVRTVLGAYV